MNLEFDNIFNASVTVAWAIFFIPYALREKRFKLLGWVSAAMLVAQVLLSMYYAEREFPFNYLAGVSIFCFGLLVGYGIHLYESRNQKD